MPRYKAVLFDIDDTLLTTREPKWRQHKMVAKQYYGIELTDDTLRQHWGKPFDELTAVLYQNKGTAEERRTNFTRHELAFPKEYEPYAQEIIEALYATGIVLGLMTAMFWEGAKIDLTNLQVPLEYFVVHQGAEATKHHKPDGRVFEPALTKLKTLGITDKIVYVGEALSDYQAAKAAGLDFMGVTQGLIGQADFESAGAKVVFSNLAEIKDYII